MEEKRYFTVAEVNALLPDLEDRVRRLIAQRQEISQKAATLQAHRADDPGGDFMQQEAELEFLLTLLKGAYAGIEAMGGEIKQPDATLIDFLGRDPQGGEVCLCWRFGEKTIGFFHSFTEGFAGRKPVVEGM